MLENNVFKIYDIKDGEFDLKNIFNNEHINSLSESTKKEILSSLIEFDNRETEKESEESFFSLKEFLKNVDAK